MLNRRGEVNPVPHVKQHVGHQIFRIHLREIHGFAPDKGHKLCPFPLDDLGYAAMLFLHLVAGLRYPLRRVIERIIALWGENFKTGL